MAAMCVCVHVCVCVCACGATQVHPPRGHGAADCVHRQSEDRLLPQLPRLGLASANPVNSRYDLGRSVVENLNLPHWLLSRKPKPVAVPASCPGKKPSSCLNASRYRLRGVITLT
eukprot:GHVU01016040.1.p2 GENE.GHVU01016040.1~~GHVU01016040.1.p2  ORF type:complete len:130 (+),score=11.38 GHVU01016040.1:47-391(+)